MQTLTNQDQIPVLTFDPRTPDQLRADWCITGDAHDREDLWFRIEDIKRVCEHWYGVHFLMKRQDAPHYGLIALERVKIEEVARFLATTYPARIAT